MFYYDSTYLLVIFGIFLTIVVQIYMTNTFNKYQNVRSNINISAAEVAKRIMNANGIYDVVIGRVPGNMTDHYSPLKKQKLWKKESTFIRMWVAVVATRQRQWP